MPFFCVSGSQPTLLYKRKIKSTSTYAGTTCHASPSVLHLGFANCTYQTTITALHFDMVDFHKSDTIVSAILSFKAESTSFSQATDVKFTVARRPSNFAYYIQTCGYSDYATHALIPFANWTIPKWDSDNVYVSVNITEMMQYVVDDYSWVQPDEFIVLILANQDFANGACRMAVISETELVVKYNTKKTSKYLLE